MDYYTPPDVHRNWKLIQELYEELNDVENKMDKLEHLDRDWGDEEETEYTKLEKQQKEIHRSLEDARNETR